MTTPRPDNTGATTVTGSCLGDDRRVDTTPSPAPGSPRIQRRHHSAPTATPILAIA